MSGLQTHTALIYEYAGMKVYELTSSFCTSPTNLATATAWDSDTISDVCEEIKWVRDDADAECPSWSQIAVKVACVRSTEL